MKAAVITGPGQVELTEQEMPHARDDIVLVQILVAPLCTEFKDRRIGSTTHHIGHEAAGIVVDAAQSRRVSTGDRVVVMPQFACGTCWLCQRGDHIYCADQRDVLAETGSVNGLGTLAEYLLKPDWLLVPVPHEISLEHAAMACCGFGPTLTAHQRIGTMPHDTVIVSGAGPVGLGGIAQGVARGATVVAVESHPYRQELARALGAVEVLHPAIGDPLGRVRELTAGRGAHGAIETSGAMGAAAVAATCLRVGGALSIVAWTPEVTLPALVPLGIDVHGCWHWNHQHYTEDMWASIRAGGSMIDQLITHRMALDEISLAMDVQDAGECGKVLMLPFGEQGAA